MGPTAIGVDFEGNFSYLQGDLLSTYNFQGDRIRVALVQPGMDFCYDEQGNFYISWNCSGEVVIRKYNQRGDLLGEMTNEVNPEGPQDMRNIILDEKISYLPHTGLILSGGGWGYIPIDFRNGKFPDMTAMRHQRQDMYTSANAHSTRNRINHETIDLTIFKNGEPPETLRFEGRKTVNVAIVYSLDTQHQYYYVYDYNADKEKRIRKIVKYDGDRLIFSTDELPINRIDFHYVNGKKFVADSKGNIYYYSGDSGGIRILRWTLK